jgi:hypothetical protein
MDTLTIRLDRISHLIVAGWTGRDRAKVQHHIEELALLGVPAPSTTPLFYRASPQLLTQDHEIQVLGGRTSGEVEPVLWFDGNTLFLGVGSDHTDRDLETYGVAQSKAICAKPVSSHFWNWNDVKDLSDSLQLQSWIRDPQHPEETLYQSGSLEQLLNPSMLLEDPSVDCYLQAAESFVLFCGTLPAIGGIRPAEAMRLELIDPVNNQAIHHHYSTTVVDIVA